MAYAAPGEASAPSLWPRLLRKHMTDAERKLWHALRDRRFANIKFRRQVPLGQYIVDFVSFEKRIIAEADGSQHVESRYDAARDRWLKAQGFTLLRFWNTDILKNLEIEEPHFAANMETGLKPLLAGYDVDEVPVSWINRTVGMGASSFRAPDTA